MIRTTPFHERTSALNETGLWQHWSGHVVVTRYQASDKFEYFAVRNSAGIFDTSPLYKYRIAGRDAERFLSGMLARDIRRCPPGLVRRRHRSKRPTPQHPTTTPRPHCEPPRVWWRLWSSPAFVESDNWIPSCHGPHLPLLKLYRCAHLERAVATLAVVEDLEVLEDRVGQLDACPPSPAVQ